MPICKNNNSNNNTNNRGDNLNLDCYHDKILSQIEKNEDKIPDYLGTIEKLKQDLNNETNIDKKLDIKDKIQYYKTQVKMIKNSKK